MYVIQTKENVIHMKKIVNIRLAEKDLDYVNYMANRLGTTKTAIITGALDIVQGNFDDDMVMMHIKLEIMLRQRTFIIRLLQGPMAE